MFFESHLGGTDEQILTEAKIVLCANDVMSHSFIDGTIEFQYNELFVPELSILGGFESLIQTNYFRAS